MPDLKTETKRKIEIFFALKVKDYHRMLHLSKQEVEHMASFQHPEKSLTLNELLGEV